MKTLKFFLFVATIFTLSACSSDDDNGGPVQVALTIDNLTGTFEFTYYEGMTETTGTVQGNTVTLATTTYFGDTFTNARTMFNSDGTYENSGSFRITTTTNVMGQDPMTESEIITIIDSGDYVVNTEGRTISFDGNLTEVIYFDGTNLSIRTTDNYTDENDNDVSETAEYRLVKM